MAVTVTKTVKPSGGDYTSLSAWEAGQQADLVTLDEIRQAECYSMSDTTAVTIDGWTTDATRYIRIYTPTAERHAGKWNTGKYRLEAAATTLTIIESCVRIEGLQIKNTSTSWTDGPIRVNAPADAGKCYISHCILTTNGGTYPVGIYFATGTAGVGTVAYIFNNIIYDFVGGSGWRYGMYIGWVNLVVSVYNNTLQNCGTGIYLGSGNVNVKNNLFRSCTAATVGLTGSANTNYNATDLSSLGYTAQSNDRVSQTFTFVDEVNDDFHLASSDAGARDFGVSDPGSGLFSDDIDGQTRSGTWDIGADEYVASGTTQTITGVSRITASTTKTETGVSRITVSTTKTVSGVSRIGLVTTQTVSGVSRITATTTQTETGVARIVITSTKTITGVSRIGLVTTQTETGVARITATTTKTITGVANISGGAVTYSGNKQLMIDSIGGKVIALGGTRMPTWVTAGRPASPKTGEYGLNTTTSALEIYNGTSWTAIL